MHDEGHNWSKRRKTYGRVRSQLLTAPRSEWESLYELSNVVENWKLFYGKQITQFKLENDRKDKEHIRNLLDTGKYQKNGFRNDVQMKGMSSNECVKKL